MLQYWSNVFAMLGVALVATAFFQDNWQAGTALGLYSIVIGAWFHGLSNEAQGGKK